MAHRWGTSTCTVVWRSDPVAIELLHRYAQESYDDAVVAAAATIVAREVSDWYRHALATEFIRIDAAVAGWRRSLLGVA